METQNKELSEIEYKQRVKEFRQDIFFQALILTITILLVALLTK